MGTFAFLKGNEPSIAPGTRIVKAAALADFVEAGRILDEARFRAVEIVSGAKKEFEAQKAAGYEDGIRTGKESLSRYMLEVVSKSRQYLEDNEERVVILVLAALKKILGELDGQEMAVRMVRNALNVVGKQAQVSIMVAPENLQAVESRIQALIQPYPRIKSFEVRADSSLEGSRCVLETKVGRVEASLESQIEALSRAMLGLAPGRRENLEKELREIERELLSGISAEEGRHGIA